MEQDAAYEGKRGALLMGVSTVSGNRSFQIDLSAPPVWDGMAAAAGRLFFCGEDGRLVCFGGK